MRERGQKKQRAKLALSNYRIDSWKRWLGNSVERKEAAKLSFVGVARSVDKVQLNVFLMKDFGRKPIERSGTDSVQRKMQSEKS